MNKLASALNAMLTQFGMDEDEWNKPTFDQARSALASMGDHRGYDHAVEVLRQGFCSLPRFSFLLDDKGNVRRVQSKIGNWVDFQQVHELFDPEMVDALLARSAACAAIDRAGASTKGSSHG